jgi:hypothetical protein
VVRGCYPDFEFTNITVNKNLQCAPHRDAGNAGLESLIIGFGSYRGGRLGVEHVRGDRSSIRAHNIYCRFVAFDGAACEHWTLPFEGDRYSAVYYKHSRAPASQASSQASSQAAGAGGGAGAA